MPPVRKVKSKPSPVAAATESESPRTVVSGQLDKKIKKQQQRQEKKATEKRGIVFIKHLPHGFFEEQLKNYFQQFGKVTRLRLSRSRRTGGSKGFAFVEFEYPEVAQVAAETMDNYLMFKKVVKAAYIPPEKQHFNYFKTKVRKVTNKAGKDIYISNKIAAIQRKVKQHNDWSDENYQKRTARSLKRVNKLNQKYAHLGIDFTKLVVLPKKVKEGSKVTKSESEQKVESEVTSTSEKTAAVKRKVQNAKSTKPSKKATKKDIGLIDLLGNTINDDSEDEDYIAMSDSDEEPEQSNSDTEDDVDEGDDDEEEDDTSSDEETYGFTKDSDSDVNIKPAKQSKGVKKSTTTFGKTAKPSKVDRFEQLIKRKPHVGAINKAKKIVKPAAAKKGKSSVQIAAAKEMAKTLKSKPNLSVKLSKKSKVKK